MRFALDSPHEVDTKKPEVTDGEIEAQKGEPLPNFHSLPMRVNHHGNARQSGDRMRPAFAPLSSAGRGHVCTHPHPILTSQPESQSFKDTAPMTTPRSDFLRGS